MNNMPNVLDVPRAQKHRSTFPLSFAHKTTQDFGKTTILHSCEVMPNDEFDINIDVKANLAPMMLPTMDNVNLYVRAFFVPFRFVWKDWEEFFSQKRLNRNGEVLPDSVPSISDYEIWQVFLQGYPGANSWLTATQGKPDYYVVTSGGTSTKYRLSYSGRLARQILEGLGYTVSPVLDSTKQQLFSALPLMSLAKIFRDYYVNPNYEYTYIDRILNRSYISEDSTSGVYRHLTNGEIRTLLEFVMFGWFESDLFTSAWKNPESAQYSSIFSNPTFDVNSLGPQFPSENVTSAFNDSVDGITSTHLFSPNSSISQIGLNVLKSVRNFVIRQSASGGRYVDQLLSRFGIRLDNNEARRSMFLGSFDSTAVIGRVDANSAGQSTIDGEIFTSALGQYTGRGIIDNKGHFHFKNDKNDFGMLIFVSHLMPRTAYYQGVKPHINHLNFNDFFNPDLEDVSTAPIPNNVLFNRYVSNVVHDADFDSGFAEGVYGFAPNYFEYKTQLDYLTGDFSNPSLNEQLKSFELMRQLRSPSDSISQYYEDDEGIKPLLGEEMQKASEANISPYSRMFLTQTQEADHFIMSYYFDVRATRDCNSLGNSLLAELNEHGNDVGKLIKVRPNGKFF